MISTQLKVYFLFLLPLLSFFSFGKMNDYEFLFGLCGERERRAREWKRFIQLVVRVGTTWHIGSHFESMVFLRFSVIVSVVCVRVTLFSLILYLSLAYWDWVSWTVIGGIGFPESGLSGWCDEERESEILWTFWLHKILIAFRVCVSHWKWEFDILFATPNGNKIRT